jgi:hypothetical protein
MLKATVTRFAQKGVTTGGDLGAAAAVSLTARVDEGIAKLRPLLKQTMEKVYREVAARHGNRWPTAGFPIGRSASPDAPLNRRTGGGLKSIRDSITVTKTGEGKIAGKISAGKLTVHEEGITIKARRGGYLAIPTTYALSPTGRQTRNPRDFENTFVGRSRRGNLIVFQKKNRNTLVPLFLLKKRVTIPARLGLEKTLRRYLPGFREDAGAKLAGDL